MPKLKLVPKQAFLTPQPTHWQTKTPEGDPPTGVLLLLLATDNDPENKPIVDLGYFSHKLHQFITIDGNAIEENFQVYAYHIVHDVNGEPFDL